MKKLLNFLANSIKPVGIIFIVVFSLLSIFFTYIEKEFPDHYIKETISYASYFENKFYDYRMTKNLAKRTSNTLDKNIVLVAIDDESLQKIGRWPFTRTNWVKFINVMDEADAKVLAFDVVFSEPELACNSISPDIALAAAIKNYQSKNNRKAIMAYSLATPDSHEAMKEVPDVLYNYMLTAKQEGNLFAHAIDKNTFPVLDIQKSEPSYGHISMAADSDGVFREYQAVVNADTLYFPSLGLAAFNHFTDKKVEIAINQSMQGILKIDNHPLELDSYGTTKIRYFGGTDRYFKISLKEVLDPKTPKDFLKKVFKNKIVYIGSTAFAAHDIRNTPIDGLLPGVFVHMNMTSMLLNKNFFIPEEKSVFVSFVILVIAIIILVLIQTRGIAFLDLLVVAALFVSIYFIDSKFYEPNGYELRLFFTFFAILGTYSWTTFINFYKANKEKKQIKGTFSRYVAPAIVDQMLSDPEKLKVGGEKKNITCIFSDVRDFTSISEKLTATQLSHCLNHYMGIMTDILFETYGTLDKYIGDAIVGYWGAPIEVKDHAYHAVRGAIKMIEAMPGINKYFTDNNYPEFKMGIGLNTGECSVGNMGSNKIFSYTALGDNMNLGSRLESLCKYYGVQLNISEFTKDAISDEKKSEFTFRALDIVRVKGKEKPVKIFEVLHSFHPFKVDPDALNNYNEAYQNYLNQKFKESLELLEKLHEKYPEDKPTKLLIAHCKECIENPPDSNWDGVTTHKEK